MIRYLLLTQYLFLEYYLIIKREMSTYVFGQVGVFHLTDPVIVEMPHNKLL